ncbi:alpha/beta fold hydrolase [Fodinicola acaciae]|uniref:alpha/beta fold hydrolase n=1 Tax=Fodinicola acaciae TaxID=2681555 RepID=UPI0013D49EF7|nr:alpha/beta hydrolase [Fodinicola acaciae]
MGLARTVEVGPVKLAFREWGDPAAAPVVLLHALGDTAADWETVATRLADSFHVFAIDLRGHGGSDRATHYSIDGMRDDVCGFLDALGLAGAHLVGHSLGGMVGYLVAAKRPDLVGRLVLEEAPAPVPVDPPRGEPARPAGPLEVDWAAVVALYAQRDQPDPCWLDALDRVSAPTLLVCGGTASTLPQEQFLLIAERIADSLLVTIPSGHDVHATRPDDFAAAVLEFLELSAPPVIDY